MLKINNCLLYYLKVVKFFEKFYNMKINSDHSLIN